MKHVAENIASWKYRADVTVGRRADGGDKANCEIQKLQTAHVSEK
jgi:hypothetical protein